MMRNFGRKLIPRAYPTLGTQFGRLKRPFSEELKRAFEKVSIPYHHDLLLDFERIVSIVKMKKEQFDKTPYSVNAFEDYAKLLLDLGFEKELFQMISKMSFYRKYRLSRLFGTLTDPSIRAMSSYMQLNRYWMSVLWFLQNTHSLISSIILFLIIYMGFTSAEESSQETIVSVFSKVMSEGIEAPAVKQPVFFKDIIGIDEYRAEVEDLVDFLKNPDKYIEAGAKMPKGVLFHGKPGTGKTELARAISNEAGCSFYYQSASEFMDSIVGQGVVKLKRLFQTAREHSPAVIFLDEIDSLASDRRLSKARYNAMELNQILTEMDGFQPDDKIIVIAATNMIEKLDKAILRAGRFDKKIDIPMPDKDSRVKLFEYFSNKIKTKGKIDFETLSKRTSGMTGADIKNMVNIAILNSVKMNRKEALQEDFDYAFDRMVMGIYRKSLVMEQKTKVMTAYHEAGHTLMNLLTNPGMKLHKVTILPVGQSLGHTAFTPSIENNQYTAHNLISMLDVAMGGRIAEELVFGHEELSTGCSQDLKQASAIANELVRNLGYSRTKPIAIAGDVSQMAETTNESSDVEIEGLLRDSLTRTRASLVANRDKLEVLASKLLQKETLGVDEIKLLLKLPN